MKIDTLASIALRYKFAEDVYLYIFKLIELSSQTFPICLAAFL